MSETIDHGYFKPLRKVKAPTDVQLWLKSKAYSDILGFITALNSSVKGKSYKFSYEVCERMQTVAAIFQFIKEDMDIIPLEKDQRFGNKAFRVLGEKIMEKSENWIKNLLPEEMQGAVIELKSYFDESFGSFIRVDYGTGHEINFIAFCCCLYKIGYFSPNEYVSTIFFLFREYLNLMRKIQRWYNLEPAGSHGVWGLDDYQFLPFIFGSSQFVSNPIISPNEFVEPVMVAKHHEDYMFLECIKFINEVKTGPFAEHSNQLWSISGVATWTKVNSGLIKMYKAEVLAKFPVIQHFVFGSMLAFDPV